MFNVNNKDAQLWTNKCRLDIKEIKKCCYEDFTQSAITCLKLTLQTLEQGVKYVQS